MTQSVTDFLLGGGSTSAKFEQVGQSVTGTITVTPQLRQQTDFATKKPLFWDDGQPKMQVVVTLQTDQRDPAVTDDDGTRNVYVKGDMQRAVRDALRQAGAKGLAVGGTLTVSFVGTEPSSAGSPKKLYAATYQGPAVGMPQAPQTGWDQQVQQQPAQPQWAATAPQAPPQQAAQAPVVDPQVVAAYSNLPAEQQDALTKGQPALRAALGLPA